MCLGKSVTVTSNRAPKPSKTMEREETIINFKRQDTLALSTYYIKIVLFYLGARYKIFEKSKCYKVLCNTTQPAHLVALLSAILIGSCMYPSHQPKSSPILNLLYICSVSAHFGAQLWMSFVSGLALYFCLPRRTFGKVQSILFPKYFLLNSILSLISLGVFLRNNNSKLLVPQELFQIGILTLCFTIELFVRLYLTPPLLHLMKQTGKLEEAAGVGLEIGRHDPGLLSRNIDYVVLYKAFRKVHSVIALGNVVTLACSLLHLHYLSLKLNLN